MTSTMIEERVHLRMRGGPPWGFRIEGNPPGPIHIARLRTRSSGKEQQIQLGDEVISINGRSVQGLSGDVAMGIVDNSVGVLELEIMRKRYEDGPANDFTSTAYSHPKIQPPQPTYKPPQPTYQPPRPTYQQPQPSYQQPQVYKPQPTYQQPYQSQPPYQQNHYTPQPASQPQPYQNQPCTSNAVNQPRQHQPHPAYQESHSTFQPRQPAPTTNNGYTVEPRRPSNAVQVSQTNEDSGGGLKIKKKTTTTTKVLTKTGGDKSERTVTKTVTERVGNKETTTTIKESSANDGYGEETGPKSVVKETRYTDEPVEDLMEVVPASQGPQSGQTQPTWAKKTPPWEGQRKKKKPVPPPPKPKPRVPVPTQDDMDRFQPKKFSPSGSPSGATSGPANYNSKPRGWSSPRGSVDHTPTSPRSVESGNAEDFRSQPMVAGDQPRKGSDGFTDFNARPRAFNPGSFTPVPV